MNRTIYKNDLEQAYTWLVGARSSLRIVPELKEETEALNIVIFTMHGFLKGIDAAAKNNIGGDSEGTGNGQ